MKSEVYDIKVDTRDKLLAHILNAAGSIKKREDQCRQTTSDLCTRVAAGNFRTFIVTRNKFVIK